MKTVLIELKENKAIKVTEDTQYVLDFRNISGKTRYSLELVFEKTGVSAEVIGIYKIGGETNLDLTTKVIHVATNTSCDTEIKGVLMDNAQSNYVGLIKIEKNASQTSSFLHDSVLVLGENTENSSQPILEIENNDVKASHGATTSRVSEDDIYYLMSRGLTRKEAEETIITGFIEDLLSRIKDPTIRGKIASTVESKL